MADMDVADMDIFCGRYEIVVADMVVADMVCGRYRRNSSFRSIELFAVVFMSTHITVVDYTL